MRSIVVFTDPRNPNRWRWPYEKAEFENCFGPVTEYGIDDLVSTLNEHPSETVAGVSVIYWKLHAERTNTEEFTKARALALELDGVAPSINDPNGFPNVHSKDVAWKRWADKDVPISNWRYVEEEGPTGLPLLVRFNNSVSGEHSYLCQTGDEYRDAIENLKGPDTGDIERRWGPGLGRKIVVQEFIETEHLGYRQSLRIIVAGDKVVTAYARLCIAPDWVAITGKFTPDMGHSFLIFQQHCQKWCLANEAEIVRAVHVLGLNFQGVDVIFRGNGAPVFLEVQPDFSTGNPRAGDKPPFYNPSYPALVTFLEESRPIIEAICPMYTHWLNKETLFRECFEALATNLEIKPNV